MKGELRKEGDYELFKTTRGHQILHLQNQGYYAMVKGQKGDILVKSNDDHDKDKTVSKGKFYYADFKGDPDFQDTPHVFLEDGDAFRELILPEGFPKEKNYQKKLIRTGEKVSRNKVLNHIR